MTLPNALTVLRIFFVPLLLAVLLRKEIYLETPWITLSKEWLALPIFLAAALTDLLDGIIARRRGQISTLGTLLDPVADKLLISAAFISLVELGVVPAWMVVVIVGREFAVSGLRSIAAAEGYTIEASELGKTKMVMQVIAVSLLLAGLHWPFVLRLGIVAVWLVVLFAIVSAVDYFRKFWRRVDIRIKVRRRRERLLLLRKQRKDVAAH
ncbi:MAG TPA: CDP-diacylglycerol--glycerol-3-phosphate 3-phosphatidyltransferase [Bryobacterales bacterium]|jgi:CDP-diacylglycerol--glycerol-3-phosphate 3-phosphatidyltransferase|nr:CDP-diacylglycerol--glycerol-3-phosphate 3-phosphatidyltransferase [Bryobacterales bacterium]